MIKIRGQATLKVSYDITLEITEEQFYSMPEHKQNELLDESINWSMIMQNAEVDDFDVWDIDKVEEDK